MKKLISVILAIFIIASVSVFPAFAQNSKLSQNLIDEMKTKSQEDYICVDITTTCYSPNATEMPSWPDKYEARAELKEYYNNWFNTQIDPVVFENVEYEEVFIGSGLVIVRVKVKDIEKIAEKDIVRSVDFFDDKAEAIPEIEPAVSYYMQKLFEHYPETKEAYECNELMYVDLGEFDVDTDNAMDYAVVFTHFAMAPDAIDSGVIAGRAIWQPQLYAPFRFGYALYDIENDEFIPFSEEITTDYPFVADIMKEQRIGTPFGDADCDDALSVMDATHIQRCLAQLDTFTNMEYMFKYGDYPTDFRSDFNLDGTVNVMDATGIQMELAAIIFENAKY